MRLDNAFDVSSRPWAVFGTFIGPYLFFWHASQEVEDQRAVPGEEALIKAPEQARNQLQRIKIGRYVGT